MVTPAGIATGEEDDFPAYDYKAARIANGQMGLTPGPQLQVAVDEGIARKVGALVSAAGGAGLEVVANSAG
jgi:hypothetical protein